MTDSVSIRFQLPGYTAAEWSTGNPVLLAREFAAETDTGQYKLGDGATAWADLPYQAFWSRWGRIGGSLANQADLTQALDAKAPLASPTLTGTPTAPTPGTSAGDKEIATVAYVVAAIARLVDASPAALDTLKELATALGNDADFAGTVTKALAGKAPLASPTLTGTTTTAGLRAAGDTMFVVEATSAKLPAGRTGQGLEWFSTGVQSYNRSTGAYGSFLVDSALTRFRYNGTPRVEVGELGMSMLAGSLKLATYTVATLPNAAVHGAGAMIFVSNDAGGSTPAFSDGTSWRRVADRAVVAA